MKTKLERLLAKHQDLVKLHERQRRDYDKYGAAMARALGRLTKTQRALARSQKRVNQERLTSTTHNAGPTASAVPALIEAVGCKPVEPTVLDDGIPDEFRRKPGDTAQAPPPPEQRLTGRWFEANPEDDAARAALAQQVAEHKKQKAQGRAAKRNAIARGDTKKMPLSGKAALEFIRGQQKSRGGEPAA
jgi:hypothetical protein